MFIAFCRKLQHTRSIGQKWLGKTPFPDNFYFLEPCLLQGSFTSGINLKDSMKTGQHELQVCLRDNYNISSISGWEHPGIKEQSNPVRWKLSAPDHGYKIPPEIKENLS